MSGIHIPSLDEIVDLESSKTGRPRDQLRYLKRRTPDGRLHALVGRAQILEPDGSIAWEDDWRLNALVDQGEDQILRTYFLEEAHKTKYGMLLNQADPVDTDTVALLTETKTPGTNGYNRLQFVSTDWGAPALVSTDYKTTAVQKTFGPSATLAWTVTHFALVTTLTGVTSPATLFILWIALAGAATVAIGQTFNFQAGVAAQ